MLPYNILMIEDNEGDIILTQEAFSESKARFEISVARDGQEGLDFLYRRGQFKDAPVPDLVLLDINMPKLSGLKVLEQIKKDEKLEHIPVVMLTTSSSEEDIMESYKLKANCYITKPVNFDEFTKVVREIESFWFGLVKMPNSSYRIQR